MRVANAHSRNKRCFFPPLLRDLIKGLDIEELVKSDLPEVMDSNMFKTKPPGVLIHGQ